MARNRRGPAVALLALVALSACSKAATRGAESPAARVEPVAGTDLNRVILSPRAVERLDLKTAPVRDASVAGGHLTMIPYAALLYGPDGATFAYTTVGPDTFQRTSLTVERIDGDSAYLSQSPPAGTDVVTVGAAELYGSEFLSIHE